jgi:hypothetical protein
MAAVRNAEVSQLFAIPFVQHVWPGNAPLNEELRRRILAHAQKSRGEQKSKDGGWHSETAQLEFLETAREPLIRQMLDLVEEATRRVLAGSQRAPAEMQWSFQAWANVARAGDSHASHTHPGSTWSGVYYVDAGETSGGDSAALELIDPCPGRSNTFFPFLLPSSLGVRPAPGLME